MDISMRQFASVTVVDLNGDITLQNTPVVRKALLDLLKETSVTRAIVNLQNVKRIDSAGVASLVEALKASRDFKTGLALYGLSKMVRDVLEMTRLIKLFEIYDNEEDALRGADGRAEVV